MMKKLLTLLFLLSIILVVKADDKYITESQINIFNGYRNISNNYLANQNQLDFLNYVFEQKEKADYNYFHVALSLRHADKYQIYAGISLYNNLIPYAHNISFNYFLPKNFGIIAGSMSYRYYLTEFNKFYSSQNDKELIAKYLSRQWKFSMIGFYLGPTYQIRYNTILLNAAIKIGVSSFTPFHQRNILKEELSNYKIVYNYETLVHFSPFMMPEVQANIDLLKYKKVILGARVKFSYFVSQNSINYQLSTYEWTYQNAKHEKMKLPQHSFQQSDWDFGLYFKW